MGFQAIHWRNVLYYPVGGESLAAITDAEKAVADRARSNGKNIRFFIISPVNTHIVLAVHVLHTQHNSHFIVIRLIIKFVE